MKSAGCSKAEGLSINDSKSQNSLLWMIKLPEIYLDDIWSNL